MWWREGERDGVGGREDEVGCGGGDKRARTGGPDRRR